LKTIELTRITIKTGAANDQMKPSSYDSQQLKFKIESDEHNVLLL